MTPFIKLQIHVMSKNMASSDIGVVVTNIAHSTQFAREAKIEVEAYIAMTRSAKDADPNWTDDEICQMILDNIAKLQKGNP